jgi:hypothetical protein
MWSIWLTIQQTPILNIFSIWACVLRSFIRGLLLYSGSWFIFIFIFIFIRLSKRWDEERRGKRSSLILPFLILHILQCECPQPRSVSEAVVHDDLSLQEKWSESLTTHTRQISFYRAPRYSHLLPYGPEVVVESQPTKAAPVRWYRTCPRHPDRLACGTGRYSQNRNHYNL